MSAEEADQLAPLLAAMLTLGRNLLDRGHYECALEQYETALKLATAMKEARDV